MPRKRPFPRQAPPIPLQLEVWQPGFTTELTALIRKYGIDADAETPARLLADYFLACLNTWESMITQRAYYVKTGWRPPGTTPEAPAEGQDEDP